MNSGSLSSDTETSAWLPFSAVTVVRLKMATLPRYLHKNVAELYRQAETALKQQLKHLGGKLVSSLR